MGYSILPLVVALTFVLGGLGYIGLDQRGLLGDYDPWIIVAVAFAASWVFSGAYYGIRHFVPAALAVSIGLATLMVLAFYATQIDIVTSATGLTVAMGIFAAAYFLMERGSERADFKQALNKLTTQLEQERAEKLRAQMEQHAIESRDTVMDRITDWFGRFFSFENKAFTTARHKMMAAGWGSDTSVMTFLLARILAPCGAMLLALFYTLAAGYEAGLRLTVILMAAGVGYWLVLYVVGRRTSNRQTAVILEMPDLLDLLVIYTEAGKSLENAIQETAARSERRYPIMTRELKILLRELAVLNSRDRAYDNFSRRCGTDVIKRFVSVIKQAEAIGSPVSETLRILAKDSRRERVQAAERKAARVPILIQIPIVLLILPALFLIIMGPVALQIMEQLTGTAL